jgi:hypothetical protein
VSFGSTAIDPIAATASPSKTGVQFDPPFSVFQTPPCAPPRYATSGSSGSVAIAVTRPAFGGTPKYS